MASLQGDDFRTEAGELIELELVTLLARARGAAGELKNKTIEALAFKTDILWLFGLRTFEIFCWVLVMFHLNYSHS